MPIEIEPGNPVSRDYVPPGYREIHQVSDNEDWATVAKKYDVDVRHLINYNFNLSQRSPLPPKTFEAVVNWYLRRNVGCVLPTADGYNWRFSSAARPGKVYIPPAQHIPPAPKMKRRFTKRFWSGIKTTEMNLHDGPDSFTPEDIRALIGFFSDGTNEDKSSQQIGSFPDYYEVIAVLIEREERDPTIGQDIVVMQTSSWKETKTYTWGEPTPFVEVTRRTRKYDRDGVLKPGDASTTEFVPRSQARQSPEWLIPPKVKTERPD